MADKTINLMNLRSAIQASSEAWNRVLSEANVFSSMGWIQADFDDICAGTDISSADLYAALAAIATVQVSYADQTTDITKLLP